MTDRNMCSVSIKGRLLILQISVDDLAFAAVNHPDLMGYVHADKDCWKPPVVTDPDKFAEDVKREIENDSGHGEVTMFEAMLDSAIINAIESGSEHITLEGDTSVSKPEPA